MDWSVPNPAETFKLFKQRIELYFKAKRIEIADQVMHNIIQIGVMKACDGILLGPCPKRTTLIRRKYLPL